MPDTVERRELFAGLQDLETGVMPFEDLVWRVFVYQQKYNALYRDFCAQLDQHPTHWYDIPCLPIQAFKYHAVQSGDWPLHAFFESSGTTHAVRSRHWIRDRGFYLDHAYRIFRRWATVGKEACILALLPSYVERKNASLVAMTSHFIAQSTDRHSGFYLNDIKALIEAIEDRLARGIPTYLFGVSFALLELAAKGPYDFDGLHIIETGGMKGRGPEIPKRVLHRQLKRAFGVSEIYSEYGMTELLSQAYTTGELHFTPSFGMRATARQITDPMSHERLGRLGIIHVIDLANIDSCAFIATEDLGRVEADGRFTIEGRLDHSDWRGCNLLIS